MIRASLLAAMLFPASVWAADFTRETWCEGEAVLPDDVGSATLFDLKLWFEDGAFSSVARNLASGEVLQVSGTCDIARDDICQQVFEDASGSAQDGFAFVLQPMQDEHYLLKVMWLNGAQGRGLLRCYSAI
ncbi:MAG: hypothetical protein AAGF79_16880 [Pseudomonadota bacterium]